MSVCVCGCASLPILTCCIRPPSLASEAWLDTLPSMRFNCIHMSLRMEGRGRGGGVMVSSQAIHMHIPHVV